MNRIYLAFPELGFSTSYYLSVNDLVIEQCAADIQSAAHAQFRLLARRASGSSRTENLYFLHTTYTGPKFARDVRGRVWEGGTVTYMALQVAYLPGLSSR